MRTRIALLCLLAAAPAFAAEAPRTAMVAAAPGYPGTRAEAQPSMDALAAALQRIAGLPEGALAASYEPTEKGGLARIAEPETGVALVPLPFFLQHGAALKLSPRLQVEMKPGGATEVWTLVAKKGRVAAPASLADFTVVSIAGYAPAFVRGALGAWGRMPESTAVSASGQVISALRKAASGEKVAVLLDGAQAAALPSLPFASELEVVARSEPLPAALVCAVGDHLSAARAKALEQGFLKLSSDPAGAAALEGIRMARFAPVDPKAIEAARRLAAVASR